MQSQGVNPQPACRKARPAWLNKKINLGQCREVETLLSGLSLNTVCHKALCPNIGECFNKKHATFLILGDACTRACTFCAVHKKLPCPVDSDEPAHVAEAVVKLGLKHVVITSVTRDDLADGGAGHFVRTIEAIRVKAPGVAIEVLIPDLQGDSDALTCIVKAKPEIIAHNVETVPSLYSLVRTGASYERSLGVLRSIKRIDATVLTKSGIMLGLGEQRREVLSVCKDLVDNGCDFLSIGQYLAPSKEHYPVQEFIRPEQFELLKTQALDCGFRHVESGPYVRSSYAASQYLTGLSSR
ncbi:MAG TPA: lipoyl synthase [Candidatus Omnitrophota bacterium]|nr:lipoyl synthase [Candidatus Omnitrophota bacterium]HPT07134.1 lipoyl synthase [Candidatus Omnitrophota bacterium]